MTKSDLIQKVCEAGLFFDWRGNIYGERYAPFIKPRGLWQHPEELASLLCLIGGMRIKSFLNVGTFNGVTFNLMADYLSATGCIRCVTVDPHDHSPFMVDRYEYHKGTSGLFAEEAFDFVFIDGHHGYSESRLDYENVGRNARVCAFHDIDDSFIRGDAGLNGGVCRLWSEIKNTRESVEFIAGGKPVPCMGIGVLL